MAFGISAGAWLAGAAVAGTAATIYSGSKAADAQSESAANATAAGTAATNASIAENRRQYDQNRADQAGYMGRGNAAGNRLSQLLGLPMYSGGQSGPSGMSSDWTSGGQFLPSSTGAGGFNLNNLTNTKKLSGVMGNAFIPGGLGASQQRQQVYANQLQQDQAAYTSDPAYGSLNKQFTGENLASDPGYQFGLREGQRGLDNSAAARGGYYSGAQLKAASKYNSDYAGTKFNDAWTRNNTDQTNTYNRLAGIAGTGQQATNQVGANGLSTAGANGSLMTNNAFNNGQNTMGAGNARASSYLATGNALQGALNQGISAWNGYNSANAFQPTSTWINNNGGGF